MSRIKEEAVVINNNKVYSSYYARACKIVPDRRLVAISIGIPDNFNGNIMRELNPPEFLLRGYKNNEYTQEEYIDIYTEQVLKTLNPVEIYNKIKGKVILCYCGKDSFCHRHIVIDWLRQSLGDEFIGNEI